MLAVAAIIVLANFAPRPAALRKVSYGWPMTWHWHNIMVAAPAVFVSGWQYNAAKLMLNSGIWLLMLAAAGGCCEWLLRRYGLPVRWSLRTMLAAIGIIAALCAWFVSARRQAQLQDEIVALVEKNQGAVYFQRLGPRWLDLVGADRFRRRIVGIRYPFYTDKHDADFKRLTHLLDFRQLRILNIEFGWRPQAKGLRRIMTEVTATIAKLRQLEELQLEGPVILSDRLGCLANSTNLRFLSLSINGDDEDDPEYGPRGDGGQSTLYRLPMLPRLEALDLDGWGDSDQDIRHLIAFPRLKSLTLRYATDDDLADLASLESLEELEIPDYAMSAAAFDSLHALKRLKTIHIYPTGGYAWKRGKLALDHDEVLPVDERDVKDLRRALRAFRQARQGIIVDTDVGSLDWHRRRRDALSSRGVPAFLREQMTFPFLGHPTPVFSQPAGG
ncbi:MAG TPA: hypothetical protein VJ783_03010 [Pirellulales bacterium]|nr:hypothetical protein [Pirellulales bacterium]